MIEFVEKENHGHHNIIWTCFKGVLFSGGIDLVSMSLGQVDFSIERFYINSTEVLFPELQQCMVQKPYRSALIV